MDVKDCEVWIDVPGTDGRAQTSNRGRLRVTGKKQGRGRRVMTVHVSEIRRLVCDYKSGRLGWYVFFDGENHFFPRDDLMALFPEAVVCVDRSEDEAARRKRDESWRDLSAGRADGAR